MFTFNEGRTQLFSVVAFTGVLAAVSIGCGSAADETISPSVEVLDRSTQALTAGALRWANGTYGAGCFGHSNGDAWSLRISGADPMDSAALSVTKNDSDCVLTLTALVADTVYEAAPSITMGSAYQGSASSFAKRVATVLQPVAFYANVKLSATNMASDFTVTILYSDDLRSVSPSATATYTVYSGTTADTMVPAPDYTATFGSLVLRTDIDGIVDSATGTVGLTAGSIAGQSYVVIAGSVGTTFEAVDTAYAGAGAPTAIATTVTAASFTLGAAQLPVVRTVIISNTSNAVRAYQVVRITFNKPS